MFSGNPYSPLNLDGYCCARLRRIPLKNVSFVGLFTCLSTLVLAFLFKDYLINLLMYLERTSSKNALEFHIILILLFVGVSLPILWGYLICILICAYVYAFFFGFLIVVLYSALGMTCSYFICRYVLYDYAHQRVQSIAYLHAICSIIQSNEKGFRIVLLSRLMPIPFGLANTLFAVTDIDFKKYMIASIVGLIPTQIILCYMGSTLKSMSDVLANESTAKTATFVFFVQLVIAIGAMFYILQAARFELNRHIENSQQKQFATTAHIDLASSSGSSNSSSSSSSNSAGVSLSSVNLLASSANTSLDVEEGKSLIGSSNSNGGLTGFLVQMNQNETTSTSTFNKLYELG